CIENVVAEVRRAVVEPHPDSIGGGMQLLDVRVDPFCAHVLREHSDHFSGIEVVADQTYRLEAMQEHRPVASPSVKAGPHFESRAAPFGRGGQAQSCDLFNPGRKARVCAFANSDSWNARIKDMQQLCLGETLCKMRGGYDPRRSASK